MLWDGYPFLGRSKTWRGFAAAIVFSVCAAVLIGLPWQAGAVTAACAMAGDCLSSFVKRRFGLKPSEMTLGLDWVPESLFPAVASSAYLPLSPIDIIAIVSVFFVGALAVSRIFFAVGFSDRPYWSMPRTSSCSTSSRPWQKMAGHCAASTATGS